MPRDRAETQGIVVMPPQPPPPPAYLEDWATFHVRDYGYESRPDKAGVKIVTTPSGADVYLNDHYRGHAPLSIEGLAYGEYLLRLQKAGYRTEERWIRIDRPGVRALHFPLQREIWHEPQIPLPRR